MSFSLLKITTLYPEFLNNYYQKYPDIIYKSFHEQNEHLLSLTSEPAGSYTFTLRDLGVDARVIIMNASPLLSAFENESQIKSNGSLTDRVIRQIKYVNPDIIWLDDIRLMNKKVISKIKQNVNGTRIIFGSHCAPFSKNAAENFKSLDFILTCTPGLNNEFRNNGIRSFLLYHAFDPRIHEITEPGVFPRQKKLTFSGSLFQGGRFHKTRLEFIERILDSFDIQLFCNLESSSKTIVKKLFYNLFRPCTRGMNEENLLLRVPFLSRYNEFLFTPVTAYSDKLRTRNQIPVFGFDMYRLLADSEIVFNIHGEIAGEYAGNVRLFEATGMGSCLVTDDKRNMKDLFEPDKEVIVYKNIDECMERIKWLMNNTLECEAIARAGQKRTLKDHTVRLRCEELINLIQDELNRNTRSYTATFLS